MSTTRFFGEITVDVRLCIVDTSLSKYMTKYIKPMSNRNYIAYGYETCISSMLLKSDLNQWKLSQITKPDKLYINYESTRLLQRYNIGFI